MINSLAELKELLHQAGLGERQVLELTIPEHADPAFALEVLGDDLSIWQTLRGLTDKTGRYPVLYGCWSGGSDLSWEQVIQGEDIFSRFEFKQNSPFENTTPTELLERVKTAAYSEVMLNHNKVYTLDLSAHVLNSLTHTQQRFGRSPSLAEVNGLLATEALHDYFGFEQWMLSWEIEHCQPDVPVHSDYLNWYQPVGQMQILLLLPIPESWQTLAFIHWYGAENSSSEIAMAMLKHWQQRYGAELVAHYGTMLHLQTASTPTNMYQAFTLACEQESLAPCTTVLPGVPLRDHARVLLSCKRWFLHERP